MIVCEPNGLVAAALLTSLGNEARAVPGLAEAALILSAEASEQLVLIGEEIPLEYAVDFARNTHAVRPDVAVVLLRANPDAATLDAAAAGDIQGVVRDPRELVQTYVPAHERLDAAATEPEVRNGQIVTVFAAKGGCGKTTMATNLAVALSSSARVCLVDLDLDFGDVAISLRLTPSKSLVDVANLQHGAIDDDAIVEGLVTPYSPQLDCVLAPAEPGDSEKVSTALVHQLLVVLRQGYDYVVIDTPSHFSEQVLAALDGTDHFILVTTPEITSLKNLRLTLDMFDLLGYARERRAIVFNRSDDLNGLTAADIEATVKAPIAAHVPASRDVPASINKGVPLAQSQPKHSVSVAIQQLATRSIKHQNVASESRLFGRRKPVRNR